MVSVDPSYTTSMESHDPLHPARQPKGYVKLAKFMVKRDHVILAKYRDLAIRDLLYLQAELCDIEYRLQDQENADANSADEKRYHDREWWLLQSAEERGLGGEHWKLVLCMREKLREYYGAIEQYRSIISIPTPTERRRKALHAYIESESLGGNCEFLGRDLGGYAPHTSLFDASRLNDLLSLGGETTEDDFLSLALIGPALHLFNAVWKYAKKPTQYDDGPERTLLYYYSGRHVRVAVDILGAVFSSLVPTAAIITLFFVRDMLKRLGLICIFTLVFAVCMSVTTRAKRIELFAATAANSSSPHSVASFIARNTSHSVKRGLRAPIPLLNTVATLAKLHHRGLAPMIPILHLAKTAGELAETGWTEVCRRLCQRTPPIAANDSDASTYSINTEHADSFVLIYIADPHKEVMRAEGSAPSAASPGESIANAGPDNADDIIEAKPGDIYMRQLIIIKTNTGQDYVFEKGHIDTGNDAEYMLIGKWLVKVLDLQEEPVLGGAELKGINGPSWHPASFVRLCFKLPRLGLDWVTVCAYVIDDNDVGFNLGNRAITKFGLLSRLHELEQVGHGWVKLRRRGSDSSSASTVNSLFDSRSKAGKKKDAATYLKNSALAEDVVTFRKKYQSGVVGSQSTYIPSIGSSASRSQASTWSASTTCPSMESSEQEQKV